MGGGLMQLVAYGAQDIYLTGNPQITFFKVVYRRHTNFSMEAIQQTMNGNVGSGARQTSTISRNGDLISKMYLNFSITAGSATKNPGHNAIDNLELEIGGQRIDRHHGHFMETWAELTEPNSAALVASTDNSNLTSGTKFQNMAMAGGVSVGQTVGGADFAHICSVPLQFWFCRNPGLALPLIALQYHEVKVIVNWGSPITNGDVDTPPSAESLWVDYIYLDTDERRRFAQQSHEYLIEQVQHQSSSLLAVELNFNHPVKELIWTGAVNDRGQRTALAGTNYLLKLNGHDRFAERPRKYFCCNQVWQHHTGTPLDGTDVNGPSQASDEEIAVYSFALKPEEHQPSGTCNFSRIDTAILRASDTLTTNMNIYAINYNVLRIMSGMGGLAYSN
jgi:hypothetical protein